MAVSVLGMLAARSTKGACLHLLYVLFSVAVGHRAQSARGSISYTNGPIGVRARRNGLMSASPHGEIEWVHCWAMLGPEQDWPV